MKETRKDEKEESPDVDLRKGQEESFGLSRDLDRCALHMSDVPVTYLY